jgi:uncharacterized membrane protein
MMQSFDTLAWAEHLGLGRGVASLAFVQFNRPAWWLVMIPLAVMIVWIARRSLSGLSGRTRLVALGLRLLLVALLIGVLAEPQLRREARDVAVTLVVDASRSQPRDILARTGAFAAQGYEQAKDGDLVGLVTTARTAGIQRIPTQIRSANLDATGQIATDATDLAGGVRAAMSVMPPNAANRIVLISDGNETIGDVMEAARAAEAAKVPIDVVPVRYSIEREVIVDRLIAPATARPGEVANLRVVLTATRATGGRLSLLINGQAVDLDPEGPGVAKAVRLNAGTNVEPIAVRLPARGPVQFEAVFEPDGAAGTAAGGDTLIENNRSLATTFIGGQGRVLVVTSRPEEAQALVRAIGAGSRTLTVKAPSDAWSSLAELASHECVVLVNAAAFEFTEAQQVELKTYVHDLGGGLVMTGGDQAFGAGGWIGSTLAEALPIKMDPPQKRQMPRGALALVMHSCEMPEGNFWGRRTAEAAIKALQSQDLAGVIEYNWGTGGGSWVYPMSVLGDKSAALRSLQGLTYGDAPDFHDMLAKSLKALNDVQAGQRHVIVISDGDPQPPTAALLAQYRSSKVAISTVAVFPHGGAGDLRKMQWIAKDTGGNYYEITRNDQLNALPEIFIKEAQTVKRSLIWEGEPTRLAQTSVSDGMRGIAGVPPISGYVVAADREGLSQVVLRGPENDPVLAQWQHGLGRVVTFTGDASSKWSAQWLAWEQFRQFWDQHVTWAMRPSTDPNVRVVTTDKGDRTQVVVEAVNEQGERLNFLQFQARAVGPDGSAKAFDLVQSGPGRYEATIDTVQAGAYTLSMGYATPGGDGAGVRRGAIQAAVTRPFADEFRALRDNAALLENVAKRTGGRVLGLDASAQLWSRDGLTMPVSLHPVWMGVLLASLAALLLDVAVRRVRIDVRAILGHVMSALGASKSAATMQMEKLSEAREKARAGMAERARATGGSVGTSVAYDAPSAGAQDAGRKFEASAAELAAARKSGARVVDEPSGAGGGPGAPVVSKPAAGSEGAPAPGAGLSRLKQAKQRAKDELGEG